jgi:hypothetical protein
MDTSSPDMGKQPPESFERIGILFPSGDEPSTSPLKAGYGRCSASGCTCPAYMGQGELCGNCGHNYSLHW